ncbi:hypothetical protein [Pseudomarimonas arenosa]|uniref:DUF3619 family protein n=1 Tax=Pseudomarimonas arenosa TaxID=2774145 RepID=A0AAW3ZQT5_9GAMM|nr:hypothetical protein [Pseudomarimonas arenosa]MBD8527469.1 hypothetical protein [Pseudomarimonas arenosa]
MSKDRWILRSRELLDQHAAALPASTLAKLAAARRHALAAVERPRSRLPLWFGAGLGAAASVLLWFAGVGMTPSPQVPVEAPAMVIEEPLDQALTLPSSDVELLASEADYALMQDLEFYAWLESGANGS